MRRSAIRRFSLFTAISFLVWATVVGLFIGCTLAYPERSGHPCVQEMRQACAKAREAMSAIRQYKTEQGIPMPEEDVLDTGMVGGSLQTNITTTDGNLSAKRTSTDPDWAAVFVGMFFRAGLKKGDRAVFVFSGSFPAWNVSAMAAAEAYGIQACIMASAGASFYGATDPDFTFFDMAEYLCDRGILTHRIDYFSFGGGGDVGADFYDSDDLILPEGIPSDGRTAEEIRTRIRTAVEASSATEFIYQPDFEKNIDYRLSLLRERAPDVGFVLNIGGSLVGLGKGLNAFLSSGYTPSPRFGFLRSDSVGKRNANYGLLQYFHSVGVPVASMLNAEKLAGEYGIPFDPPARSDSDEGQAYYLKTYNAVLPVCALIFSVLSGVAYLFIRLRYRQPAPKEKNYIR